MTIGVTMTSCKPISYEKRKERLEKNRASDPRYAGCVLEQLADVPLRVYLSSDEGAIRNVLNAVPERFALTQDSPMKAVCYALTQFDIDASAFGYAVNALAGPIVVMQRKVRNG